MDETSQAIGALQAQVEFLKEEMAGLRAEVQQLVAVMNAGKGSWRALVFVGAVATSLGAGVATVVSWLR